MPSSTLSDGADISPVAHHTRILPINVAEIGPISYSVDQDGNLDDLDITRLDQDETSTRSLTLAAEQLRLSDVPVAFPTETVYGLGADATRSEAVKGIYAAKQRPSDNPLIVHFSSLHHLTRLLQSSQNASSNGAIKDLIPSIYKPLIKKFWPGPLTIILPNPPNSPLAPEVTAGLSTFGWDRYQEYTMPFATAM